MMPLIALYVSVGALSALAQEDLSLAGWFLWLVVGPALLLACGLIVLAGTPFIWLADRWLADRRRDVRRRV